MKTVATGKGLEDAIAELKAGKEMVVGFVPTMGALHQGHLSLVRECKNNSNICVVSIFVNPTQFNDKKDLENYPRTPEQDLELLKNAGVDLVFMPEVQEMYPEEDNRKFDFGLLETVMEGVHRPGHFNGVAQIVSKLFNAVKPDKAFFGEKDFQQLAIIKTMVKNENYPIEIVPCATVRENDGLAMSSRNLRLTPENRTKAPLIHKVLSESVKMKGQKTLSETKDYVINALENIDGFQLEYFDIVNSDTLETSENWSDNGNKTGCVAIFAGEIRLIDNISYQ